MTFPTPPTVSITHLQNPSSLTSIHPSPSHTSFPSILPYFLPSFLLSLLPSFLPPSLTIPHTHTHPHINHHLTITPKPQPVFQCFNFSINRSIGGKVYAFHSDNSTPTCAGRGGAGQGGAGGLYMRLDVGFGLLYVTRDLEMEIVVKGMNEWYLTCVDGMFSSKQGLSAGLAAWFRYCRW